MNEELIAKLSQSIDKLTLTLYTRNKLKKNNIFSIANLLSRNTFKDLTGITATLVAEIEMACQHYRSHQLQAYHKDEIDQAINHILSNKKEQTSTTKPIINPTVRPNNTQSPSSIKVFQILSDTALQQLHALNIYTHKDMLSASLYQLASISDISLQLWQKILTLSSNWGGYQSTLSPSNPTILKRTPYQIEQFNLPTYLTKRLIIQGVTNLTTLTQLTLGDALSTRNLGVKSILKLITFLAENKKQIALSLSKNPPPSSAPIINKLPNPNIVAQLIPPKQYQHLQQQNIPLHKISINRLALPFSLSYQLFALNITTIQALIAQNPSQLTNHNFSQKDITHIKQTLNQYCTYLLSQSNWHIETTNTAPNPLQLRALKQTDLTTIIKETCSYLNPKYYQVINVLYGLDGGESKTLRQATHSLNIARTRIQQLRVMAFRHLKRYVQIGLMPLIINLIASHVKTKLNGIFFISHLQPYISSIINIGSANFIDATTFLLLQYPETFIYISKSTLWGLENMPINQVEYITTLLKQILNKKKYPLTTVYLSKQVIELAPDLKNKIPIENKLFIKRCLFINKHFMQQADNTWILSKWQYSRRIVIISVLRQLKQPAHFEKIAYLANATLPPQQQGSSNVYQSYLQANKDLFVRTGIGTYGLAEWGLTQARFYIDIIVDILEKAAKPLPFDELVAAINAERECTPEKIMNLLHTYKRFTVHPNKTISLTKWQNK